MSCPTSVRADNAESRPDPRSAIPLAINKIPADFGNSLAGINSVFHRSCHSNEDMWSAFESVEDLVVAVAHEALFISQPLVTREPPHTLDDVRSTLVAFGLVAWREYSTTLVGFIRMMMAEGARNPTLKKRVYEAGLEIVTRRLREFLSDANEKGILSISDAQMCAEQLMGLLREPLYQELMLNPAATKKGTAGDQVKASIERFLHGCATGVERQT